jgi:hypothetical protein
MRLKRNGRAGDADNKDWNGIRAGISIPARMFSLCAPVSG